MVEIQRSGCLEVPNHLVHSYLINDCNPELFLNHTKAGAFTFLFVILYKMLLPSLKQYVGKGGKSVVKVTQSYILCLSNTQWNSHFRPNNTYWAILSRTLLANRGGHFFSSSVGICVGRNLKKRTNRQKRSQGRSSRKLLNL